MIEQVQGFRLSPQQKRLWSCWQGQAPGRACCRIALDGPVHGERIYRALKKVARRHEILRTRYQRIPGIKIPVQMINPIDTPLSWQSIDVSTLESHEREASGERIFYDEIFYPWDLEQQVPLRAILVMYSAYQHILFISTPALSADGWTFKNMLREIEKYYEKEEEDHEDYEDDVVQYAQFVEWYYEMLADEEQASDGKAYWNEEGRITARNAKLPGEGRADASNSSEFPVVRSEIHPDLARQITALSDKYTISTNVFFLTCWHILLWRLAGESHPLVTTILPGRTYEELLETSGLYTQALPSRASFEAEDTFLAVLQSFAQLMHDREIWQEYLVEEEPGEPRAKNGLDLPIGFELAEWDAPGTAGGVTFTFQAQYTHFEPFKVKLFCIRQEQTLFTELLYDANIFSADTMRRLAGQLQSLLQDVVANPGISPGQIGILSPDEWQCLLIAQNSIRAPYPQDRCVQQLFEQQVARTPDTVAIVAGEQYLTYSELNARANQLAHHLRAQGVGADTLVALCLERSPEMIIGVLGILKAGGAYVPLDVNYPPARIAFMVEDTAVSTIVTTNSLAARLSAHQAVLVCLDGDWETIAQEKKANPSCITEPEHLIYVLYTSGSTGRPKGIMIDHRGLICYLSWCIANYGITEGQGTVVHSSIGFDLTITSLFPPLITGQKMLLLPEVQGVEALAAVLHRERDLSLLKVTPAHLEALKQVVSGECLEQRVRTLIIGGEALFAEKLSVWREHAPTTRFINEYGPTETVVGCCVYELRPHDVVAGAVAIGKPIANMQMYILDSRLLPVPTGVVGELYIGGDGLARGYLKRPDLTADRFVPHPFVREAGQRLYRTGDLGCYRADGTIDCLGRSDTQVKIRGNRVELGEIEGVLHQHPGVQDAVVLAREDVPGNQRVVAYVIPQKNLPVSGQQFVDDIRKSTREMLPEYMLPSAFVVLETFPLTSNGKIDRSALPVPGQERYESQKTFVTPQTPIEQSVAQIWAQLLGLRRVGMQDNFFEAGGHSMLATQLISRVRSIFHVEMSLGIIFDAPTLAEFAPRLEEALRRKEGTRIPPMRIRSRGSVLPLSFAQQRLWFLDQLEPGSSAYLVPGAQWVQGFLDTVALERSIQEIVSRHESLRTTFQVQAAQPIQVIHPARRFYLPLIDLRELSGEEREEQARRLAGEEARQPCDLVRGPLLQVWLLRLQSQEHVLLMTLHHIISDGWSMQVFERELSRLYQAFVAGEDAPLLPLPLQYGDFALWQRQWLQGEALNAQRAYWYQQLAGAPLLELPTDHPRPPVQSYQGALEIFHLPLSLYDELLQLSQREDVTMFMLLLASFVVLLARSSGQYDISVGTPIANRTQTELEGLIGFFVNTLVLRIDMRDNPRFVDLLGAVREVALGAYMHQDLPFEYLVEDLQPERDLSRSPLFQVMFSVQQSLQEETATREELQMRELVIAQRTTKFDLSWTVVSTAQELHCGVEYSTDLYEPETIRRLLQRWQVLLEGIVADPYTLLSDLPLLTRAEYQQAIYEWNSARNEVSSNTCVHTCIETEAQQRLDMIALVFGDGQLSYGALTRRANQIANHLHRLGVGPEILVGLCMERSLDLVVSILSILKAGGAYVPLDPAVPTERLAFMLKDAAIPVLLTRECLARRLPAQNTRIVCLDRDWESIAAESQEVPLSTVVPDNSAYLIYTSGSTGNPKGVVVSHASVMNAYYAWENAYSLRSRCAVYFQMANVAFDVFTGDMTRAFCAGGRLVLCPQELLLEAEQLYTLMKREQVDSAEFVPGVLRNLLAYLRESKQSLSFMQVVIVGSDSWYGKEHQDVERFCGAQTRLINSYGVTEATIDSTYFAGKLSESESERMVPIGRPFMNTQIYLLDEHLHPVPVGSVGEMYIGGAGVARGYHQHPELTSVAFLPDPFSVVSGARMYCTGDNARYLPDGNLEFIGRGDTQVKLRGYRIELGEIESVVGRHPAVRGCAVVARDDVIHGTCIVAYTVGQASNDGLRRYMQERLPAYMVPSFFVALEAFPLTANGKVDRRAFPSPKIAETGSGQGEAVAWTPIEEVLGKIWCDVLGCAQVGLRDNFFTLGGHSLLATQLISRVRSLLHREIPLRSLFEEPTIAGFAPLVEQELRGDQSLEIPPLVPMTRTANSPLPLSFAQQRLWFLDELEPDSVVYLIPNAWSIQGVLDSAALENSLHELARRHESLRTTFEAYDGRPVQVVHSPGTLSLPLIDVRGLATGEREREARRLADQEARQPCNLRQGPLWRVRLVRLAPEEQLLLVTFHHIIADAWSIAVFRRELGMCYQSLRAGQLAPFAPLPVQYADFALWQRQWLQGQMLEVQRNYWKQRLAGVVPLELATDHPRPSVKTYHGALQAVQLPKALSEELLALSQREGVTLFMLLLAAFYVLLARYSGQTDIAVGTPLANRTRQETEGLIGFFINTLVMRANLADNPPFTEFLGQVREVALGAYAHQDIPFEQLVEDLQPERDLSRSALFQVMFNLQQMRDEATEGQADLTLSEFPVGQGTTKFDLTLTATNSASGLHCALDYNTDCFEAPTITRMLMHWQVLLEGIVAGPQQRLASLPLLTQAERQQLLVVWNQTARAYPLEQCLHEAFEVQAEQVPDVIALVFEDEQLTYQALNQRANRLAHYICSSGSVLETGIGICLERSLSMIVAMLGVLKAGGMYIPLDPATPQERLAFMLQDTRIALVLTQQSLLPPPDARTCPFFCVDADWSQLTWRPEGNLKRGISATNAAYLLYTSGSTGVPKGVVVEHRQLMNYVRAVQERVAMTAPAIYAMVQPLTVDSCLTMIFPPLHTGGTLHILTRECALDPGTLAGYFIERPCDYLKIAPSHLAALLAEVAARQLLPRRALIIGGEASQLEWVQQIQGYLTEGQLYNHYGPTETTVGSLMYQVQVSSARPSSHFTPVGTPLANTQIYVLDRQMQPVPIGVVGELYLGGMGLARGYLKRPDATAERFVPDPFGPESGSRMYRTGDLVRYRAAGELEFMGRNDEQVKIRGYRVESGEVEAALLHYPGIREAVVQAAKDATGSSRLVAYVVTYEGIQPSTQEVQRFLHKKLPAYMVPSAFSWLEALPLTPHGKVDRKALLRLIRIEEEQHEKRLVLHNTIEELVMGIWKQVLGRDQMDVHDTFFELGGHSLLAVQVISRVRAAFQCELPLSCLFEAPTVASFSQRLGQALRGGQGIEVSPLLPVDRTRPLPLSFAQQRLWFLDQLKPENVAYLIPNIWLLRGDINRRALQRALEAMVQRHESLRTTFRISQLSTPLVQAGQPVQVIHTDCSLALPLIDLHDLDGVEREREVQRLSAQETSVPCNLRQGPLLRGYVLYAQPQEHYLLLTLHHIIADGWSMRVLGNDLSTLYQAFTQEKPVPLLPLPVQYADFAVWQRQWLQGKVLEDQLAYWRRRLAGVPAVKLPLDRPRPPLQSYQGRRHSFAFSRELSLNIMQLSHKGEVTVFMVLLAAFKILLYRYSRQEDIVLGTDSANRNFAETERMIGFFINILVLRTDLSGKPTFREVLRRVRETVLGASMHQETPFELLVEKLAPEHTLDRTPLVQALFVQQNLPPLQADGFTRPMVEDALPEADTYSLVAGEQTAKFDLAVFVSEVDQRLVGAVDYSRDLFDPATIETLMARFEIVLQSIVQQPASPIDLLAFFTPDEQAQAGEQRVRRKPRAERQRADTWIDLAGLND